MKLKFILCYDSAALQDVRLMQARVLSTEASGYTSKSAVSKQLSSVSKKPLATIMSGKIQSTPGNRMCRRTHHTLQN